MHCYQCSIKNQEGNKMMLNFLKKYKIRIPFRVKTKIKIPLAVPDAPDIIDVLISRYESTDQGTFGILRVLSSGFRCHTLELPNRDNAPNMSCIPAGTYTVVPYTSRKFGICYLLKDVQGRTWILTHTGNVAGDTVKGWHTQSAGCILVGKILVILTIKGKRQKAVLISKSTFRILKSEIGNRSFLLKITEDV